VERKRTWYGRKIKKPLEAKSLVLGTSQSTGNFLLLGAGSSAYTPAAALNLYETSTAVSVPINVITDAFSVIEPILKDKNNKRVRNHPVLNLLKRPSAFFTQELFMETIAKDFLITGETGIVALGSPRRPPQELQPLSPKVLTPLSGQGSDAPSGWSVAGRTMTGVYQAQELGKDVRYLNENLRELKVIRNYSTKDNALLRGQSRLLSASQQVRQDILGSEHNVQLLERGGRVSLVFHFDADLSPEEFEVVKKRVRDQFGGATQAGEIGVTAGGQMKVQELGIAPKDMDFGGLQAMAQKSVALVYRVPIPLITDSRQTLNNYREGKLALYDDAVIPLAKRLLGALGDFLFPRFGMNPLEWTLALNPDDVSALVSRRNDELEKRRRIGVESTNEFREEIGKDPDPNGDDILVQATLVPLGSDVFGPSDDPEPVPPGLEQPGDEDDEDEDEDEDEEAEE
jgi:HK97 family phage portal protein